jgi:hypothetical protein
MIAILRRLVTVALATAVSTGAGYLAGQQVYDHPARYIVLHHQGGDEFPDRAAAMRWFLSIGDSDIAYNAMVTRAGAIWPGRDERYQSAANLGLNRDAVAICLLGNLDAYPPTDAQLVAAGRWVHDALKRHPHATLIQHRDVAKIVHDPSVATTCAGAYAQGKKGVRPAAGRVIWLLASGYSLPAAKAKALKEL